MKDSFVLYTRYRKQFSGLSSEQKGVLFDAILAYCAGEDLPPMDALASLAFDVVRVDLDDNAAKYEDKCRKNRENVSKRWHSDEDGDAQNDAKDTTVYDRKRPNTKRTDNDNDSDSDVNIKKESVGKKKPERHKYGMYRNVLLSDDQMEKLKAEIPNYLSYIELVSEYVAKTGKGYKDYLAAIRSWYRKDQQEGKNRAAPQRTNSFMNFPERDDYNYEELGKILNFKPV